MKQIITRGIVLSRTNYGEADRIISLLTPDQGKVRLLAKGVRKIKSKLAGGIELFSTSEISFIQGRGELGTLVSSRLVRHYGNIATDIHRVQLGYELIKRLNKTTEDEPEQEYYDLLELTFQALGNPNLPLEMVNLWFTARLLNISGHAPNLKTDSAGKLLDEHAKYAFDPDSMSLVKAGSGNFGAVEIKAMRLLFTAPAPEMLNRIGRFSGLMPVLAPEVMVMAKSHLRI